MEEHFVQSDIECLDIKVVKVFMLLYADDIVTFGNSVIQLQEGLNLLSEYCQNGSLHEDEYHFVIECSLLLEIKNKFIHKYYWKRPIMFNFFHLIDSSNHRHQTCTSYLFMATNH